MTALFSVYTKTNAFKEFAGWVHNHPMDLLASSGTKKFLDGHNIPSKDVADIVGPPILGHRVVTLSREVYASLLARPDNADDLAELARLGLTPITLVYVDLYPLADAIADETQSIQDVIEKIDIGGPTLLRAAAKAGALVVSNESHFEPVVQFLEQERRHTGLHQRLASDAEGLVATYALTASRFHYARQTALRAGDETKWRDYLNPDD